MAHAHEILEMVRKYKIIYNGFGEIAQDVIVKDQVYCGVLKLTGTLDLLFYLYRGQDEKTIEVAIYRGFPSFGTVKGLDNELIRMYLSQAIGMFPEIKTVKFQKDNFPKPYYP